MTHCSHVNHRSLLWDTITKQILMFVADSLSLEVCVIEKSLPFFFFISPGSITIQESRFHLQLLMDIYLKMVYNLFSL